MHPLLTKLINCPVLPPTLAKFLLTAEPALLSFSEAELWTRERPSCALLAVSCALLAASEPTCLALVAASEVLEAARRWMAMRDWRRANRGMIRADIVY